MNNRHRLADKTTLYCPTVFSLTEVSERDLELAADISYYFASAAVAADSSHTTASTSASWSRSSPPSNFVNGHVSTMWFMVCCWPQSQEGDWARLHLCKLARHGPWPVRKRLTSTEWVGWTADWRALLSTTAATLQCVSNGSCEQQTLSGSRLHEKRLKHTHHHRHKQHYQFTTTANSLSAASSLTCQHDTARVCCWVPYGTLMLLAGRQEGHPACKKLEWWSTGMVVCLERRCRLAYGPADATATHCLLLQ